jgi:Tfp pilus assembly protein PilN
MWNPLRSERDMFRFLVQVGGAVVVLIVLVVVLRAIF